MSPYDGHTTVMRAPDLRALGLDDAHLDAANDDASPKKDAHPLIPLSVRDLRAILPLSSTDETRYNLCGVLVEVTDDSITLVATDGHRLGRIVRKPLPIVVGVDDKGANIMGAPYDLGARKREAQILSRVAIEQALKLAGRGKKGDPYVLWDIDGSALLVGNARIDAVIVSGVYPDYLQVVPKYEASTTAVPAMNLTLLAGFAGMADLKGAGGHVKCTVCSDLAPVLLSFADPDATGVIMPMRA